MIEIRANKILLLLIVGLIWPANIHSQSNLVPFGARPAGLGDAFVAVADDANAVFWNPAGISTLERHELNTMTTNSFGIGLHHNFATYVFPLSNRHSVGLSLFQENFADTEIDFGWDIFQLSYGREIIDKLSIGGSVKRANYSFNLDQESLGSPSGWGFDLGVLYNWQNLKFGLLFQDIGDLTIKFDNGSKEDIRQQAIRLGLSYEPINNMLLAGSITFDDRVNLGTEYWLLGKRAAIRAGLQRDIYRTSDPEMVYSFGVSAKHSFIQFDYSYSILPTLQNTNRFSVSLVGSFTRSKMSIGAIEVGDVFASRYIDYFADSLGTITITNREKFPVIASATFFAENLMGEPQTLFSDSTLVPNKPYRIPLKVTFSKGKVFNIDDNHREQGVVKVSYFRSDKAEYSKKTEKEIDFDFFAPGEVSWADGPSVAASFISPTDEVIQNFAKNAIKQFDDVISNAGDSENLVKAAILFDALGQLKFSYKEDTKRPFRILSQSYATDNIRYPRQMLERTIRFGDCDDLTVLYASLLEALNIETIVALAPGHLYLYFNSGILQHKANQLLIDSDLSHAFDDYAWIPVETTDIGKNFWEAVYAGAAREGVKHVKVHKAWNKYRPAFPSDYGDIASSPTRDAIEGLFIEDHKFILERGVSKFLEIKQPQDKKTLMQAARIYIETGKPNLAIPILRRVLQIDNNSIEAMFLLGEAYTDADQLQFALQQARELKRRFPRNPRGDLISALVYFQLKNYDKARQEYNHAKALDPNSPLLRKFKYNIPLRIEQVSYK